MNKWLECNPQDRKDESQRREQHGEMSGAQPDYLQTALSPKVITTKSPVHNPSDTAIDGWFPMSLRRVYSGSTPGSSTFTPEYDPPFIIVIKRRDRGAYAAHIDPLYDRVCRESKHVGPRAMDWARGSVGDPAS